MILNVESTLILFCLLRLKLCVCKTQEYDFIVVGGGLAGCIVASRLSELYNFTVLLIEAGGEPPFISQIPMLSHTLENTEYDWNHTTVPQRNVENRTFDILRGKMLGGCGSFNSLFWLRGNKRDFDIWNKHGVKGWNWDSVLPYFKKTETDLSKNANTAYSGLNGPIPLTNDNKNFTLFTKFINEMRRRGYNYKDTNDGNQRGYSIIRLNINASQRQSTYTNYLKPALNRNNLRVIKNALVTKILFNKQKEAIGVVYEKSFKQHKVMAKREVIVSGGAINTPQLLMVSGIGPKKHLEAFKIKVISDLPIGNNLQNHLKLTTFFWKNVHNIYTPETLKLFFKGNGPLTKYSVLSSFMNTNLTSNPDFSDTQIAFVGQFIDFNPPSLSYMMMSYILRPKSFGTIRLQSIDPKKYPLIDPNYLSNDYDMLTLIRLIKQVKNISEILNSNEIEYSMLTFNDSQCNRFDENTDEYWRCIVRTNVQTACHYCCTCRMGSSRNSTTVVDSKLRVLGVKKLRVIDASVMPSIPSCNIQAVVAMIAEKGSDLIKQSHIY